MTRRSAEPSLVSDAGWVAAAIRRLPVDLVLAELRKCVAAAPGIAGPAPCWRLSGARRLLLRSQPDIETSQILRQLSLQAMELDEKKAASDLCSRLGPYPGLVPLWSSRRPYRALIAEINAQAGWINAVALARDGRVVVGADDGRVWIWDPSTPSAGSLTLGRHDGPVRALAIHQDGRVVSGGQDKSIRVWDPNRLNAKSVELGRHDGAVRALAILDPDHVISGGDDWLVRIWTERGSVGSTGSAGMRVRFAASRSIRSAL